MTTSSEDVLLPVNHVKFKKNDGTLYLMAERIGWIVDGKDTFSISHKYADIKMQKISPDGKAKIQLQIVLHDGENSTFHFVNPMGPDAQRQDRDSVKEILLQMLPKFKRKVNKELEEKNRRLAEDPELFQLYKDLVTTQVITAEDFWTTCAVEKNKNGPQKQVRQEVGVSAAFLTGIKPEVDGSTGLKYNLTTDTIESIFRTYPAVKKKHLENVPVYMDETEFWKQFFQSHYFHRDRLSVMGPTKDIFTECAKSDEIDVKKMICEVTDDPLLDLNHFDDVPHEEGYGHSKLPVQGHQANQNLIKRFNHHSIMVLKACESKSSASVAAPETINGKEETKLNGKNSPVLNGLKPHNLNHSSGGAGDSNPGCSGYEPRSKKARLKEKMTFDDLTEVDDQKHAELNLAMTDRYLRGPAVLHVPDYPSNEDEACVVQDRISQELASWQPSTSVLSGTTALSVLSELSPGGALMKNSQSNNNKMTIPADLQQEMKQHYNALCELLRHFWSCFPVTTPFLEEKVLKIRGCIERFQYAKLAPFQDKLQRDHYDKNVSTSHLHELIEAAYAKFTAWQARRASSFRR